jgi:hypothetical protein
MLITLTFLSIALLAINAQFPMGLKMSEIAEGFTVQTNLAQELLEEIRGVYYWEDPVYGGAALGPDGEADRWSYNDVDDYDGLLEAPPYDLNGDPMDGSGGAPNFSKYRREVTVTYADATTFDPTATATDLKRIEVTVTNIISQTSVTLTTIVARIP